MMEGTAVIEKLKYPIGKFVKPQSIQASHIDAWIKDIASFPSRMSALVSELNEAQLSWQYRPAGWSIRQVVHHCADSHMNAFIRHRLCITEYLPTIKPYDENKWAVLSDINVPVPASMKIIEGLHARWAYLLGSLSEADLQREFIHPEHGRRFSLAESIGLYAWHCNHHLAHVQQAIALKGTFEVNTQ